MTSRQKHEPLTFGLLPGWRDVVAIISRSLFNSSHWATVLNLDFVIFKLNFLIKFCGWADGSQKSSPAASRRRYAPTMRKTYLIFLTTVIVAGCGTKQWNLNKSIGWKSDSEEYTVLYTNLTTRTNDSSLLIAKARLDSAILKNLESHGLGAQADNEDSTENNMNFVVLKDYDKALEAIVTLAKTKNMASEINIVERVYTSSNKWTDKTVYVGKK